MNDNYIEIPYLPRDLQEEIHNQLDLYRFAVLVCHRRFGKSTLCINQLVKEALTTQRRDFRGAYIAPLFKQSKSIAWDYMKYYCEVIPGVRYNESELKVDFPNGARINLLGADNPDAIRGIGLDIVILDEVAQMKERLWTEVIRPLLTDRNGKAIFIGTPQGHNLFYDMYMRALEDKKWYAALYKASQTGIIDEEELKDAMMFMSPESYAQEFECSFTAAVKGAYYGNLIEDAENDGRITSVPYETDLPVHTAWDLGVSDSMVVWFYQYHKGGEVRMIDYLEGEGEGLQHYIKLLKDKPYIYGEHYAPHDIKVRELSTGKTRLETAEKLGITFQPVQNIPVQDGIHAVRSMLPRCWFDKEKCWEGIEALRHYRRDFNEKNSVFKDRPLHDWTSHASDGFRYLAVSFDELREKVKQGVRKRPKQTKAKMNYAVLESAADR